MIKSINDDLEVEETEVLHSGKKTDLSSFQDCRKRNHIDNFKKPRMVEWWLLAVPRDCPSGEHVTCERAIPSQC